MFLNKKETDLKPLVLLDVDGVINDLTSLYSEHTQYGVPKPDYPIIRVKSAGHIVHIPEYMPELIQRMNDACEIQWLTTWRERANGEITDTLGIGHLGVVTDGGNERVTSWKPAAATPVALEALEAGREVWWIEDFYGAIPYSKMPRGVRFIDTAYMTEFPVLTEDMIPSKLLGDVGGNEHAQFSVASNERMKSPTGGGLFSRMRGMFK